MVQRAKQIIFILNDAADVVDFGTFLKSDNTFDMNVVAFLRGSENITYSEKGGMWKSPVRPKNHIKSGRKDVIFQEKQKYHI